MELKPFITEALRDLKRRFYRSLDGLSPAVLAWQPGPHTNSIGFLFWHITRVEDRLIVYGAQGKEEIWRSGGWYHRWGIPVEATGLHYPPEDVATFPVSTVAEMQEYFKAVRQDTLTFMQTLEAQGFNTPMARPPYPESPQVVAYFEGYTVGRAFRQLIIETSQHLGQMDYIRGLQRELGAP